LSFTVVQIERKLIVNSPDGIEPGPQIGDSRPGAATSSFPVRGDRSVGDRGKKTVWRTQVPVFFARPKGSSDPAFADADARIEVMGREMQRGGIGHLGV
jgi:hypothetical protein